MIKAKPISLNELNELNELSKKSKAIPCFNKVYEIAEFEIEKGNILLAADNVSSHPSETYYILQFKFYSNNKFKFLMKNYKKVDNYERVFFNDNFGAIEIRFNCDWEIEE